MALELSKEQKIKACESCKNRRNYYCNLHNVEWSDAVRDRDTCVGWGNEVETEEKPGKIRLGVCMPNCSMGGVTRGFLTMMNAPVNHDIEWAGIAINKVAANDASAGAFDPESAKRILKHCPIYCSKDHPKYQGLVTIVDNACQTVVDRSDVVNLWGYIQSNEEIDAVDWNSKPNLIVAHGQCDWTRKNLAVSLSKGTKHILGSVSPGGVKCFPDAIQDAVSVVYNGVDFSRCAPASDRDEVRREWGISEGVKTVGYIGRFMHDKNPLATAKAVSQLGEGYHAVYVGEGYQRNQVIEDVKKLCGDRVTFVPRTEDIGSVLNALDCMLLASPSEGGPNTVIEAWVAGCPVVSTPVGMIPDLEQEHGLLTFGVPHDPTARELAEAVRDAINGNQRIERARKLAWNMFSPARMVKGYETAIKEALKPEPQPESMPENRFFAAIKWVLKCLSTTA